MKRKVALLDTISVDKIKNPHLKGLILALKDGKNRVPETAQLSQGGPRRPPHHSDHSDHEDHQDSAYGDHSDYCD